MIKNKLNAKNMINEAFAAIDKVFNDDETTDNDLQLDGIDVEPLDDFDCIREFMLTMEWEFSEREMHRFNDFISDLMPYYPEKTDQNVLKMMSGIVRYMITAQSRTLPETFHVLNSVAETFCRIHQADLKASAARKEVKAVYQKVMQLRKKVAALPSI